MIEKFKTFLAGAPAWIKDEDARAEWVYQVTVILPSMLQKWYDPNFGNDVWSKDDEYYKTAKLRLSALNGFKKNCANCGDVLHLLGWLATFLAEEKRKAGLSKGKKKSKSAGGGVHVPDVLGEGEPTAKELSEGALKQVSQTKHERNPVLRQECLKHFGTACRACGMKFEAVYGEIGKGYIEVHHLKPISQTGGAHTVNPKTDLVPLCANCHAMIHRLMVAEKKATGKELEGSAALTKLKGRFTGQGKK